MIDAAILRVLLEASLRVLLVVAAVGGVLAATRVRDGGVRHAAWTMVVVAMLLMPVLPFVVPQVELPRAPATMSFLPVTEDLPYIGDVDLSQRVGASSPSTQDVTAGFPDATSPGRLSNPIVVEKAAPAARRGVPLWLVAVLAIYGAGLLMLLVRWIRAARFLSVLRRASHLIDPSDVGGATAYESPLAATPMTVGGWRPWIVLPVEWRKWTAEKRQAVLAHEQSHVRRHDSLISLVAYVNRCIYWFNPLSWWLERQLAESAEHAADDAGVKAIGKDRAYAEVLLDMAAVVQRHGGRVAWQGVGVDGNGLLGKRIDRVLSGAFLQEVSRMKKRMILVVSILAISAAVACKRHAEVPPLVPNPETAARTVSQKAHTELVEAARHMSAAEVATLKTRVDSHPDDFEALEKFLIYYSPGWRTPLPPDRDVRISTRRPYVLRLIAEHPDHDLTGSWYIRIFPAATDPLTDTDGYAQAKALWLAHAAKPDVSVAVLKNAATFFEAYDPALSEGMLLKVQARQPGTVSAQLGRLYGIVVSGTYAATPLNVPRYADRAHATSPLATAFGLTLAASNDAVVLSSACAWLLKATGADVGVDVKAKGQSACERAAALGNTYAADLLARQTDIAEHQYITDKFTNLSLEQRMAAAEQFDEKERLLPLLEMAERAYEISRDGRDTSAASVRMATEALVLADKPENATRRAAAIYRANMVLGANALRKGDRTAAVKYLLTAVEAPPARVSAFASMAEENDLVNYLLKYGERESIIQFYEKATARGGRDQPYYAESAKSLRAGMMPMRYQYYFAKETDAAARR